MHCDHQSAVAEVKRADLSVINTTSFPENPYTSLLPSTINTWSHRAPTKLTLLPNPNERWTTASNRTSKRQGSSSWSAWAYRQSSPWLSPSSCVYSGAGGRSAAPRRRESTGSPARGRSAIRRTETSHDRSGFGSNSASQVHQRPVPAACCQRLSDNPGASQCVCD